MREVAACVVSDGTVHLPKNSLSVGVNGDRMSRAPVLGQDEIAILEGSVRGSGRYSFPRRSAETTVITAAKVGVSRRSLCYRRPARRCGRTRVLNLDREGGQRRDEAWALRLLGEITAPR